MLQGLDGNLYFTGKISGTQANSLMMWNDTTWITIDSTGGTASGGKITGNLCIDAHGNIYASAISTTPGKWQVAKWDGVSWSVLRGAGNDTLDANYMIYDMCIDTNGYVYVSSMTPTPGSHDYIARYDGNKWTEITPDSLVSNRTLVLCADYLGNIYAAGYHIAGLNEFYVAKWDGNSWARLNTMTDMFNGPVRTLYCDSVNNIYAAGDFTDINGYNYVAKWDGMSWSELGTGANALQVNDDINTLHIDTHGKLYAAGRFENAAHRPYVAVFDGTSWSELGKDPYHLDINISNSIMIDVIASDKDGNIYAGGSFYEVNKNGLSFIARYGEIDPLEINTPVGEKSVIAVFPNPTKGMITIYCSNNSNSQYVLLDVTGTIVKTGLIDKSETEINITELPPGSYFLKAGNDNTSAVKIVKF